MAALTPEQRARYQRLAAIRNDGGQRLSPAQRRALRNLEGLRAAGGTKSLLDKAMGGVDYGDAGFLQKGAGGGAGGAGVVGAGTVGPNNIPATGYKQIDKSTGRADAITDQGMAIGQKLLPEVFAGGSGLDRITFNPVAADRVDFDEINKYLQPSVNDAMRFRGDVRGRYGELMDLRRDKLGGLNAAENQALKDSLFRDIDRQRAGAMRDIARTRGLGAGASFAQRRAIGRDYGDAAIDADRKLLLDNIGIKRQALGDFEGALGARTTALGAADANLASLRGNQATFSTGVDQFNVKNKLAADEYNSKGNVLVDQFNAGQQSSELGARIGAVSAGTGIIGDERDKIRAKNDMEKMLAYLEEQDKRRMEQARSLFG